MRNRTLSQPVLALALVAAFCCGCGGQKPTAPIPRGPIDPATQPDELSSRLSITGQNRAGSLPTSSTEGPEILLVQPSASVTADNTLFLPFSFRSSGAVRGLYLSVVGASNYWDISFAPEQTDKNRVVPIGIPAEVLPGDFTLEYSLYDDSGHVGATSRLQASVVPLTSSPGGSIAFPRVEGSDGLTVRTYNVGTEAGTVTIEWETYTVPDRVDIRYAGEWVHSTGTILGTHGAAPIAECAEVGPDDGFVGSSGTFEIQVDPKKGGIVDVYVSGCLNGSTAWNFQVAFASGAIPCATYTDSHVLAYGPFQIPLGTWMYRSGNVANWLGRSYVAFGSDCQTEATLAQAATATPPLYEPINVVFLDTKAQSAVEAQAAIRGFMANQSPAQEESSWHSGGYYAVFGAAPGIIQIPQYPAGYTWSDGNAYSANNHGRTFSAFEWTQNGHRVFVTTAAFSREGGFDLSSHDFISFNCARDALRAPAGWTDSGLKDLGNAYPPANEGCAPGGGRFVTADHNGARLFVKN